MRSKSWIWIVSVIVLLVIGIVFFTRSSPPRYTLTEIKGLAGAPFEAHAINNRGQIVGVSITARGEYDIPIGIAAVWIEDKSHSLGIADPQVYCGFDINNNGQIVGYYRNPRGKIKLSSFIYKNGKSMELGQSHLLPYAINEAGDVIGGVEDGISAILRHGKLRYLGSTSRYPVVMNDIGQVVCEDKNSSLVYLWEDGKVRMLGELDEKCNEYLPQGINNRGQVVGVAYSTPQQKQHNAIWELINRLLHRIPDPQPLLQSRAFISENGKMRELDAGNVSNVVINNHGEIAGTCRVGEDDTQPFIMLGDESRDLNDLIDRESGYTIKSVSDINDKGEIIGQATHDGEECAVLLKPISR